MSSKILAGYCAYNELTSITKEDAQRLTHLNIDAGQLEEAEKLTLNDELVSRLRSFNPNMRIVLSFGGVFSRIRDCIPQKAQTMTALVKKHDLDGIDLRFIYPCCRVYDRAALPEDKTGFTSLIRETRTALERINGGSCLLTLMAGSEEQYLSCTEIKSISELTDLFYVMTYDMRGSFQVLTGHHTNLYLPCGDIFTSGAALSLERLHNAGVPKDRLVMGAACHSRIWEGVPNRYQGHQQIAKTIGRKGADLRELQEQYIDKNGFTRYWDDKAKAAYLFNGETFISYEDEQSVGCKCEYIIDNGFGGMFFTVHTGTLLQCTFEGLKSHQNGGSRE